MRTLVSIYRIAFKVDRAENGRVVRMYHLELIIGRQRSKRGFIPRFCPQEMCNNCVIILTSVFLSAACAEWLEKDLQFEKCWSHVSTFQCAEKI